MLKSVLLLSAVSLILIAPTPTQGANPQDNSAAPATVPAATATNPVKPTTESQAKAKSLYQIDCAMCHGDNGNGQTDVAKGLGANMPDFTNASAMSAKADGEFFAIIRNGKDKMPPEAAGRANDAMVWNLIIYIRNMSKGAAPAPAAK
jgi:mono/diheme cytochrome c family protein